MSLVPIPSDLQGRPMLSGMNVCLYVCLYAMFAFQLSNIENHRCIFSTAVPGHYGNPKRHRVRQKSGTRLLVTVVAQVKTQTNHRRATLRCRVVCDCSLCLFVAFMDCHTLNCAPGASHSTNLHCGVPFLKRCPQREPQQYVPEK